MCELHTQKDILLHRTPGQQRILLKNHAYLRMSLVLYISFSDYECQKM